MCIRDSFNRYFTVLKSQHKHKEIIETFHKLEGLGIPKSEAIYANTIAAHAFLGNR